MNTMASTPAGTWAATWQYGPDAGATVVLGPGRYVVGRAATADLRCDDPALDRHVGTLEIGRNGTIIHRAFATGAMAEVGEVGEAGLALGASTLVVRRGTPALEDHATVVDGALVRRPRAVPRYEPASIPDVPAAPADRERPGGLLPAALGLGGAAAMALLLHQTMFLLFGAIGSCVALGSWLTQWLSARRRHRHAVEHHRAAVATRAAMVDADRAEFIAWHCRRVPTLQGAMATVAGCTEHLWERRGDHPDAFVVSLGDGPATNPDGSAARCLPVDASLADGDRVGVLGPDAPAVARAIIAQLTSTCGPADLRIVVVTDQPARWAVFAPLPHVTLPDASAAVVDEAGLTQVLELLGTREHTHLLVVTDCPRALATRTSPLRRLLASANVALLASFERDDGVPHVCTSVLRTEPGAAWWTRDLSAAAAPVPVRITGLGAFAAAAHAHSLASLRDPEDGLAIDTRVPRQVALLDLVEPLGPHPAAEIARRWAGVHGAPRTPIGRAADGIVDIDLVRDGPHGLLAGTTGAGKSELLRSLVAGLALHTSPERLAVVLVDYKGGASFDALVRLPHVVGVITDLDGRLADRALRSLHAELRRREGVLREHGVADVTTLHTRMSEVTLPRLLVVIDEFAALVAEQPDFLHALVGVAQRGRSLGVHLLLATQRPHGVISDDIRANTDLRIALRLLDQADALDVVGDRSAATLPRTIPGRGVLRLGADEHVVFQTAHLPSNDITTLVDQIVEAAQLAGANTADAPWLPPLPRRLRTLDLPPDALGLCDDPDHQAHLPLRWTPADGDVLVVGSARTGRSSALRLLVEATLDQTDTHVYVLYAGQECAALPHPHPRAARVHASDGELVARLLHRLQDREMSRVGDIRTVLVVDDLDDVRRTLDDPARVDDHDALDAALADGGLRLLVSATRPSAVPATVTARCAHRWVMHLHDPLDASVLGVRPEQVPAALPGRAHLLPEGLEAQLALPGRHSARRALGNPAAVASAHSVAPIEPIDPVPARLRADTLSPARRGDDADLLAVGIDCGTGATAILEVPDGEHVLVLGAARTGRSTALTRMVIAWREVHPHGVVVAVLPRRSSLDRHHIDHLVAATELGRVAALVDTDEARTGGMLLLVDDAELVDDPDGVLARLAAARRPGCTIVAAARPDAIRQAYGHWTGVVRRSRLGIVATGGNDTDGDLLGVLLPRRTPLAPRAGLAWIVDRGRAALAQVAIDTPKVVDGLRVAN